MNERTLFHFALPSDQVSYNNTAGAPEVFYISMFIHFLLGVISNGAIYTKS